MLALSHLEERIGYHFKDQKLLRRAVTHRSYAAQHNERLEFLGDSVLNCVIGFHLFLRDKHFTEGELSRVRANLVCEKTLYGIALRVGVTDFLLMGEGEHRSGGAKRPSTLADAMEAIFGAVFYEAGFAAAQEVILRVYEPILSDLKAETFQKDSKTVLQELLQGEGFARPEYTILSTTGAAHARHFVCECRITSWDIVTKGEGLSRRIAEQAAANLAIEQAKKLGKIKK